MILATFPAGARPHRADAGGGPREISQNGGMPTQPRPSVLVFATGGTIGMHETGRGLAPDPEFPAALETVVAGICARAGVDFRINHLTPPIDSANADAETAPRIARAVRARVNTHRPRGVGITHGTDTLAFTAARLAFELADIGAPVVLTGSQLPLGTAGSDAPGNLALAIGAAVRAKQGAPASIAFGGSLVPAVRATKFQTDDPAAFRAERGLGPNPIGMVDRDAPGGDPLTAPARIVTFRFVPGVTADDLRAAVGARPDGIVLECYGSGNAPTARPGMLEALREASSQLPIVAVTQCATGGIDLGRYAVGRELESTGVIDGGDMTLEAALAKLAFAVDRGARGPALRGLMQANLVGERGC